jgi:hypothetical protein
VDHTVEPLLALLSVRARLTGVPTQSVVSSSVGKTAYRRHLSPIVLSSLKKKVPWETALP